MFICAPGLMVAWRVESIVYCGVPQSLISCPFRLVSFLSRSNPPDLSPLRTCFFYPCFCRLKPLSFPSLLRVFHVARVKWFLPLWAAPEPPGACCVAGDCCRLVIVGTLCWGHRAASPRERSSSPTSRDQVSLPSRFLLLVCLVEIDEG